MAALYWAMRYQAVFGDYLKMVRLLTRLSVQRQFALNIIKNYLEYSDDKLDERAAGSY